MCLTNQPTNPPTHPTHHLSIHPFIRVSVFKLSRFNCDIRQTFKILRILSWSLFPAHSPTLLLLLPLLGHVDPVIMFVYKAATFAVRCFPFAGRRFDFRPLQVPPMESGVSLSAQDLAKVGFSALNWNKSPTRIARNCDFFAASQFLRLLAKWHRD